MAIAPPWLTLVTLATLALLAERIRLSVAAHRRDGDRSDDGDRGSGHGSAGPSRGD